MTDGHLNDTAFYTSLTDAISPAMERDAMPDFLGPLYDGDGILLEGEGPDTFTAMQDVAMAFQADASDLDCELRLGDRLWVIPLDLN